MNEKTIHKIFQIGVIVKGINAAFEIITGGLILFVTPALLSQKISLLTQGELTQDPKDFLSNYLVHISEHYSIHSQIFASVYLMSHGIIKILLVWGLLKNKLWAYPAALAVLSLFIVYQITRFLFTHSPWLLALTIFDLTMIWLIWHEYNVIKKSKLFVS